MTGMYVHFYQDRSFCLSTVVNIQYLPIYRLYVASYKINVGKSQFVMFSTIVISYLAMSYYVLCRSTWTSSILTDLQNTICFKSTSPAEYPVKHYEMSITDVSREVRLFKNISSVEKCTSVEGLFNSLVCSLFNVSIRAYIMTMVPQELQA